MPGKIVVTLELDSPEAEILIAALRDEVVLKSNNPQVSDTLDRIAHEIEEQVG